MFLRSRFDYLKSLEVVGLALMISVLGAIVSLLLTVDFGPVLSGHAPKLVMSEATLERRSVLIGGAGDAFAIWFLVAMSVGLSRLAGVSFLRAAWLLFVFWMMQYSLLFLLGAGQAGA